MEDCSKNSTFTGELWIVLSMLWWMPSYIFTSTFTEYIQSVDVDLLYFDINAELILLVEKWNFEGSLIMVDIQGFH